MNMSFGHKTPSSSSVIRAAGTDAGIQSALACETRLDSRTAFGNDGTGGVQGFMRCARDTFSRLDARWFQIAFLASFLVLGALARDFALTWQQVALTFASALATQAAWQWGLKLPNRKGWSGYLSAIEIGRASCRERVYSSV